MAGELDVEVVVHGPGALSAWARTAAVGGPAAVSGPGRGHDVDQEAAAHLLAGDETALPAMAQLLEALPAGVPVRVVVEIAGPGGRMALPPHPRAVVDWVVTGEGEAPGAALVQAIEADPPAAGTRVWAAGEAAAMQRIRRFLFEVRGLPRGHAAVRGYWKHGRGADAAEEG